MLDSRNYLHLANSSDSVQVNALYEQPGNSGEGAQDVSNILKEWSGHRGEAVSETLSRKESSNETYCRSFCFVDGSHSCGMDVL